MWNTGWRLWILIVAIAILLVGSATFILITADNTDPTVRPARPGADGGTTPRETAQSYVAALNQRNSTRLVELSVADTTEARRQISALLERDGGQQIHVNHVHIHPGVASYHTTVELSGNVRSEAYHQTLELNKREQQWLIVYTSHLMNP